MARELPNPLKCWTKPVVMYVSPDWTSWADHYFNEWRFDQPQWVKNRYPRTWVGDMQYCLEKEGTEALRGWLYEPFMRNLSQKLLRHRRPTIVLWDNWFLANTPKRVLLEQGHPFRVKPEKTVAYGPVQMRRL